MSGKRKHQDVKRSGDYLKVSTYSDGMSRGGGGGARKILDIDVDLLLAYWWGCPGTKNGPTRRYYRPL